MHPNQKIAWFSLAVIGLTMAAYMALIPVIGPKAAPSAFSLLALLAFGVVFYSPKKSKVVLDELDGQIATKANSAGFFVFWFYYVASSVSLPFYLKFKDIPVHLFTTLFWFGPLVFMAARAAALLVYYRYYSPDSGSLLDGFRQLTALQVASLNQIFWNSFISSCFLWVMPVSGNGTFASTFGITGCVALAAIFFSNKKTFQMIPLNEREKEIYRRSSKRGYLGLALALVLGLSWQFVQYNDTGVMAISSITYVVFCGLVTGLLSQPATALYLSFTGPKNRSDGATHQTAVN